MNAKEINQACIEACERCPQFHGFDDDQDELVNGRIVNVTNLYKKGIVSVINYWRNRNSIGGSLLYDKGYLEALPYEVIKLFDEVDLIIDTAIAKACAENLP